MSCSASPRSPRNIDLHSHRCVSTDEGTKPGGTGKKLLPSTMWQDVIQGSFGISC